MKHTMIVKWWLVQIVKPMDQYGIGDVRVSDDDDGTSDTQ